MKMYIAVLDAVNDFMVPTLVAHSVLGAHLEFEKNPRYQAWLKHSFKKCTVRVNEREFEKIAALNHTNVDPYMGDSYKHHVYLGHENTILWNKIDVKPAMPWYTAYIPVLILVKLEPSADVALYDKNKDRFIAGYDEPEIRDVIYWSYMPKIDTEDFL